MICPECGVAFVGSKHWRQTREGPRFGEYYRRCPAGHEFKEPVKPNSMKLRLNAALARVAELEKELENLRRERWTG